MEVCEVPGTRARRQVRLFSQLG